MIDIIEDLIPKHYRSEEQINWKAVTAQHKFSDNFIDRYKHKLDWERLSSRHPITDNFLEKFERYIFWDKIIFNPTFSYNFVLKCLHKLTNTDIQNYMRFNMKQLENLEALNLIKEMLN